MHVPSRDAVRLEYVATNDDLVQNKGGLYNISKKRE